LELAKAYKNVLNLVHTLNPKATLIAVSKNQSIEDIAALYFLGHRDFGENYVQELKKKSHILSGKKFSEIRWHFIGHLQRNKVAQLLPVVASIHSVDSEKLALSLSKKISILRPEFKLPVFIQVNIDQEKSKAGLPVDQLIELCKKISKDDFLDLKGLMCISKKGNPKSFSKMKNLSDKVGAWTKGELSMGMSSDFEIALKTGATTVRVGSQIFGGRQP
jgi:PLP dependent protein